MIFWALAPWIIIGLLTWVAYGESPREKKDPMRKGEEDFWDGKR